MEAVFLKILNMSIAAGWLVLAVTLLRFVLKKAPKRIMGILWTFAGMRLLLPISLESRFSLIPSAEVVPQDILLSQTPQIQSGIPIINNVINPAMSNSLSPSPIASANPMQIITCIASVVWVVGITAMLLYTLISYLQLKKQVNEAVLLRDDIWICDHISSPFILGVRKPRIYLPSKITDTDLHYVLSHEHAHLKRRDHIWKPLGFLLLTIYWFNPLMWLAYFLLCRDIELACDEKVLADEGEASKKPYSDVLINCSVSRRKYSCLSSCFCEAGVKERVKNVLNYKKPAFWIIIAAIAVCIIVAVCFLTNPQSYRSLSGKLGVSMDMAVAAHNPPPHSEGAYAVADYNVLQIKKVPGKTTVYAWILYEEFVYDGNDVKVDSGSHIPTVITFDTSDNGDRSYYDVLEYWQPRDGSYYPGDIRSKFPITLWLKASDNSCIDQQRNRCRAEALDYFTATALRPMIMVDGVIFMGTGKEVPVEIDPSAIIGEITSTVAGDTRPIEDGQSNFGCEGSPYAYYEDGLAVLIDNGWFLFELDGSSTSTAGGVDGPESVTVNIRIDVCELYLEVLEDLWNVDSGLNDGISQIGIDLSELSHLTGLEKVTVMEEFASKHNLPYIAGTWEELCEQGYIDKENLYWKDGLFFSIMTNEEAVCNLPIIKEGDSDPELTAFDAQKWRSGAGAYFFGQCTAKKNAAGTWSYTVGQEAIS